MSPLAEWTKMMVEFLLHPATLSIIFHTLVVSGLAIRIIMRRPPVGVASAWLLLISAFPIIGALIYLLIGERRLGSYRANRVANFKWKLEELISQLSPKQPTVPSQDESKNFGQCSLNRIGTALLGSPLFAGTKLDLHANTHDTLAKIAQDIDSAQHTVSVEFYIWNQGGVVEEVKDALIRAASRGIKCRVLIDALGARPWWKSPQPQQLRDAGVEVLQALPVGVFRTFIGRTDLRLHRKIVVIDHHVAWTGSMNMVDPNYFKQNAGVGQWIDAMVRIEGNAIAPLALTMLSDWCIETNHKIDDLMQQCRINHVTPVGDVELQVIPSGPGQSGDCLLQMLLTLIQSAEHELIITTPYLIPEDSLLRSLHAAAARGVCVRLIVPEKIDSFLTRHACHSYFDDLLDMGINIHLYRNGLLHTKSITVDSRVSMFGTVNFDMRSFWLNYEVALFVQNPNFSTNLRALQLQYLDDSDLVDSKLWQSRPFYKRLVENSIRLASPLL